MDKIEEVQTWYQTEIDKLSTRLKETQNVTAYQVELEELLKIYQSKMNELQKNYQDSFQLKDTTKQQHRAESLGADIDYEVRKARFYVQPFYSGPKAGQDNPEYINVCKRFNQRLMSGKSDEILAIENEILNDQEYIKTVTPMTLFVLSARLYDVNLRDRAVFWYYVGQSRAHFVRKYFDHVSLEEVTFALASFMQTLGGIINGYAFCDIDKQADLFKTANEWSIANPYRLISSSVDFAKMRRADFISLTEEQILRDFADIRVKQIEDNKNYFADEEAIKKFKAQRKENSADKMYCWK
jgi:hypothetical protein